MARSDHYKGKRVYVWGDDAVWKVPASVEPSLAWFQSLPYHSEMRGPRYNSKRGRWSRLPIGVYQTGEGRLESWKADVEILHYDCLE